MSWLWALTLRVFDAIYFLLLKYDAMYGIAFRCHTWRFVAPWAHAHNLVSGHMHNFGLEDLYRGMMCNCISSLGCLIQFLCRFDVIYCVTAVYLYFYRISGMVVMRTYICTVMYVLSRPKVCSQHENVCTF